MKRIFLLGIILLFLFSSCSSDMLLIRDDTFAVNGSNISYNNCSVGINTSAPNECLHVEGNVRFKEIVHLGHNTSIRVGIEQ